MPVAFLNYHVQGRPPCLSILFLAVILSQSAAPTGPLHLHGRQLQQALSVSIISYLPEEGRPEGCRNWVDPSYPPLQLVKHFFLNEK